MVRFHPQGLDSDLKLTNSVTILLDHYIAGDINLSNYEGKLGDSFTRAKGGSEADLRLQIAIFRYVKYVAKRLEIDIVLMDLGPNLGALNRAIISGSDYFIMPVSVDLFSLKGVENLGEKLVIWNREWKQLNESLGEEIGIDIPQGQPIFLGYVVQQHNIRKNSKEGITQGWEIFMKQLEPTVKENIVDKLLPLGQVIQRKEYKLGNIPNLHSLIPYALDARKPVFDCTSRDGLNGAHITRARESRAYFDGIIKEIIQIV